MQTTTMSILAMLRLATTTAIAPAVDIIGCDGPARADVADESTSRHNHSHHILHVFCIFIVM